MKFLGFIGNSFTVLFFVGCLMGNDNKKEKPKFNELTLAGELADLPFTETSSNRIWSLKIDSIFAEYPHMWDQETYGTFGVCTSFGRLGYVDTLNYTNEYMGGYLTRRATFWVPRDTVQARNFTHWRLDITCPDSIPVPQ